MPQPTPGTEQDWAEARRLFEAGLSYGRIVEELAKLERPEGVKLPSLGTIRRRAIDGDWKRAVDDPSAGTLGPARQTLEQRKDRVAAFKVAGELNLEKRLQALTDQLADACGELVSQMFSPHDVVEIKVVPRGGQMGSEVEVVEHRMPEPTPRDKQALATAASQLIDRLQLLTGGATSRSESGPIPDRAAAEAKLRMVRDELAERRTASEVPAGSTGATG